jgi:hypothetical protein
MKCAIFGATGAVGKALAAELAEGSEAFSSRGTLRGAFPA